MPCSSLSYSQLTYEWFPNLLHVRNAWGNSNPEDSESAVPETLKKLLFLKLLLFFFILVHNVN